jgi:hypothetical protein
MTGMARNVLPGVDDHKPIAGAKDYPALWDRCCQRGAYKAAGAPVTTAQ